MVTLVILTAIISFLFITNDLYPGWFADSSGRYTRDGRMVAGSCIVAIFSSAPVDATVMRFSVAYDELSRTMSGSVSYLNCDILEDLVSHVETILTSKLQQVANIDWHREKIVHWVH